MSVVVEVGQESLSRQGEMEEQLENSSPPLDQWPDHSGFLPVLPLFLKIRVQFSFIIFSRDWAMALLHCFWVAKSTWVCFCHTLIGKEKHGCKELKMVLWKNKFSYLGLKNETAGDIKTAFCKFGDSHVLILPFQ